MAGAISGAYPGTEAIPWEWRAKLQNGEYIETLAEGLTASVDDVNTG